VTGNTVGCDVGCDDGCIDGCTDGCDDGCDVGCDDGKSQVNVVDAEGLKGNATLAIVLLLDQVHITQVRAVFAKADDPIDVTDNGIVTRFKSLQFSKANAFIDVTDDGISIDTRGTRSVGLLDEKSCDGIVVSVFDKVTSDKDLQLKKALEPRDVTLLGIDTDVNVLHPEKAFSPRDVTVLGIDTDVKFEHPLKALSPIKRRPVLRLIVVNEVHPWKA
jgi:hypothetical protein